MEGEVSKWQVMEDTNHKRDERVRKSQVAVDPKCLQVAGERIGGLWESDMHAVGG